MPDPGKRKRLVPKSSERVIVAALGSSQQSPLIRDMGVAQNLTGGVTQVLVHVSTYQGSILGTGCLSQGPFVVSLAVMASP